MKVELGTVIRSSSGSYDVTVQPKESDSPLCCICASNMLASWAGIDDCALPGEGTQVSFIQLGTHSKYGIILSSNAEHASKNNTLGAFKSTEIVPSGGSISTLMENGLKGLDISEGKDIPRLIATGSRPLDVYPGDKAMVNKQSGVAMLLLSMLASLKASERAKIECFVMDDLVRMVSGHFQHYYAVGETQSYNDGGRLSTEYRLTNHQQELFGTDTYTAASTKNSRKRSTQPIASNSKSAADGPLDIKERFQLFIGDLGAFVHLVITNPILPPGSAFKLKGTMLKSPGLLRQILSKSGGMYVQHADDLILQRTDFIPVPSKLKEPWDPEGDTSSDISEVDNPNKPFKFDKDKPWAMPLAFRDIVAWANAQNLKPVDRRKKDWGLPEEGELASLNNMYDPIDKDEDNFEDNCNRQSYFGQMKDGSIVLRDAWGSSIYMRGGNIHFDCPGEIFHRSGRNQVFVSGSDICLVAAKSADLTAAAGDVRFKANRNLHACAGGIMLEATSSYELDKDDLNFKGSETLGEKVKSGGIILKSQSDRIFIWAHIVHIAANFKIFLETLMNGPYILAGILEPSKVGEIVLSTAKLTQKASKFYLIVGKAGLEIAKNAITKYGKSITSFVTESKGVQFFTNFKYKGNNNLVLADKPEGGQDEKKGPMRYEPNEVEFKKGDVGFIQKIYNGIIRGNTIKRSHYSGNKWLERPGYYSYMLDQADTTLSQRPNMHFSFRTSEQYHTDQKSEIDYTPSDTPSMLETASKRNTFHVYQAPWEYLYSKAGDPRVVGLIGVTMTSIEGSHSTPWPGILEDPNPVVCIAGEESNIVTGIGHSKDRDKVKDEIKLKTTGLDSLCSFLYKTP